MLLFCLEGIPLGSLKNKVHVWVTLTA
uniref:Uncharacterized protein n=1 Tax=Anguilla anguilla TaxID=7936 RepID=A0A0E9TTK9_ANGAN